MLYLVEREAAIRTGRLAVGIRFKNHNYGMFSPPLADSIDELENAGFLQSRVVPADSGEGRSYRLGPASEKTLVSAGIRLVCEEVFAEYGRLSLKGLVAKAKATEPFLDTPKGKWINWRGFIENRCEGEHQLAPEVERELIEAKERARSGRNRVLTREQALRLVTAHG
ncbi:MAG: SocA family protein [Thermoplasmata archaeon]|nr:SocA family protein [Thermoplasmata archaeon]